MDLVNLKCACLCRGKGERVKLLSYTREVLVMDKLSSSSVGCFPIPLQVQEVTLIKENPAFFVSTIRFTHQIMS